MEDFFQITFLEFIVAVYELANEEGENKRNKIKSKRVFH